MNAVNSPLELEGYIEAVESERIVREVPFILFNDWPMLESVAGFQCVPLTLPRYYTLRMAASPFLSSRATPETSDICAFLWIVSPEFVPGDTVAQKRFMLRCKKFIAPRPPLFETKRAIRKFDAACFDALMEEAKAVLAIREYMAEAMQDAPEPAAINGIREPDYYCDAAGICAALGRHLHFSERDTLAMPLKRIFQYLKNIREFVAASNGKDHLMSNPSDDIIQRHLELANQRN